MLLCFSWTWAAKEKRIWGQFHHLSIMTVYDMETIFTAIYKQKHDEHNIYIWRRRGGCRNKSRNFIVMPQIINRGVNVLSRVFIILWVVSGASTIVSSSDQLLPFWNLVSYIPNHPNVLFLLLERTRAARLRLRTCFRKPRDKTRGEIRFFTLLSCSFCHVFFLCEPCNLIRPNFLIILIWWLSPTCCCLESSF